VLAEGRGNRPRYHGVAEALTEADTMLRLFGKPEVSGKRRMAVTLARDVDIAKARAKALRAAAKLKIEL
jgi:phosphoribosylglycinamide formyltransferase 2